MSDHCLLMISLYVSLTIWYVLYFWLTRFAAYISGMLQNNLSTSISVRIWLFCKLQRQFKKSWKKMNWYLSQLHFYFCKKKTNYWYTLMNTSRFLSKMKNLHPVSLSEFWYTLLQFQLTPIRPFADFASSHQGSGHFRDQLHPSNLLPDYIKLKI